MKSFCSCIICLLCVVFCPTHAISIVFKSSVKRTPNLYSLNSRRCIFCANCSAVCPVLAISQQFSFDQHNTTKSLQFWKSLYLYRIFSPSQPTSSLSMSTVFCRHSNTRSFQPLCFIFRITAANENRRYPVSSEASKTQSRQSRKA